MQWAEYIFLYHYCHHASRSYHYLLLLISLCQTVLVILLVLFNVFNSSSVALIESVNTFCFWVNSLTFDGSNFKSILMPFNSPCSFLLEPSSFSKAFPSLVVSPSISIVIPFILLAYIFSLPFFWAIKKDYLCNLLRKQYIILFSLLHNTHNNS